MAGKGLDAAGLRRLLDARNWLIGEPGPGKLPARVERTIHDQQRRAEMLITVVQLVVVLGFGTLYATAPMAQGQVQRTEIIPWVLTAYVVFTLVRWWLATHDRLGDVLLYLSTLIDMALLVVTIWSFHLEYAQPATFYLKAPTQFYFFIFIVLRALRFEARFVVVAGLAAAAGWAALTLFVLSGRGGNPNLTHDFVEYITSNATLLGAEIDKIIVMLTVTAILALAIARARRLLVRAVVEGAAARDLLQFFDPQVARHITGAELRVTAGQGVLRDAAILTVDIRGFTALSTALPPAEVMALLQEYQARLCPILQDHGGAIDKFLGDGILASFGAVGPSEGYAADALRAADAVLASMREWNEERLQAGQPRVRVGLAVASGSVLFGAVGGGARLEYTVIGDAVNLSAKLEAQNKIEGSAGLTDRATYELALAQGYVPEAAHDMHPQRAVAGVAQPVDLVVLAPL